MNKMTMTKEEKFWMLFRNVCSLTALSIFLFSLGYLIFRMDISRATTSMIAVMMVISLIYIIARHTISGEENYLPFFGYSLAVSIFALFSSSIMVDSHLGINSYNIHNILRLPLIIIILLITSFLIYGIIREERLFALKTVAVMTSGFLLVFFSVISILMEIISPWVFLIGIPVLAAVILIISYIRSKLSRILSGEHYDEEDEEFQEAKLT
jgi:hypothetical protein